MCRLLRDNGEDNGWQIMANYHSLWWTLCLLHFFPISCSKLTNCFISPKHVHAKDYGCWWLRQVKYNHTWKWMHEKIGDNKIWYQNMAKGLSIMSTWILHWTHYSYLPASYLLFPKFNNLLSAISRYKFHTLKD